MKENLVQVPIRPQRRNQRDYHVGFKLSVVSQVEKGELNDKLNAQNE
jgi:hypothetical protein